MTGKTTDILRRLHLFADRVAIVYVGTEVPYAEIPIHVSMYHDSLKAVGVRRGDTVGIMLPNSPAFVYGLFSIWKRGAIAVPINIHLKKKEMEHILDHSGMKVIFADSRFSEILPECKVVKYVDDGAFLLASPFTKPAKVSADEAAIIMYTSGTTDKAKGVVLTHHNLLSNIAAWLEVTKQDSKDTILLSLPFFHIFGLTLTLLSTLSTGGKGVILPWFIPQKAVDAVRDHGVTIFPGVPTMFAQILKLQEIEASQLSHLRFCVSGGAPLPDEILTAFEERFSVPVIEGYGLTETSPLVAVNPFYGERKVGSVGTPVPGVEVKIVDDHGSEVQTGEIGEVTVRGANIMKGYYKMPDITAKSLQNGWFFTGDLGKMDNDGYLYIVDRKKDLIITGGYNVFPQEVEKILLGKAEISEAAVIGVPDPIMGEIVKAFVVLKQGMYCDPDEIIQYCKERIASIKCPKMIEVVPDLPKNATGKLRKNLLRKPKTDHKDIEIRECTFQSAGSVLSGRLFLPKNISTPVPLFVLSCGIGGRKEWFEPVFPSEICKRHFALFTFDLRGHDPSGGELDSNVGSDIAAAIEYGASFEEIDSSVILLGGQCLGGILCNAYAAKNPSVKGIVNISIFLPDPVDALFTRETSDSVMHQIRTSKTHSAEINDDDFFEGFARYLEVLSDVNRIGLTPYLLIHYQDDPVCPSSRVKEFFDRLEIPFKKSIFLNNEHQTWISKMKHAMSYDDPQVAEFIGKWIEEHFGKHVRQRVTLTQTGERG